MALGKIHPRNLASQIMAGTASFTWGCTSDIMHTGFSGGISHCLSEASVYTIVSSRLPWGVRRTRAMMAQDGTRCDPSGRSTPREINSLFIWQQRHVFYFAGLECKSNTARMNSISYQGGIVSSRSRLTSWSRSLSGTTAQGATTWARPCIRRQRTCLRSTINLKFGLACWCFGLDIAISYKQRLG